MKKFAIALAALLMAVAPAAAKRQPCVTADGTVYAKCRVHKSLGNIDTLASTKHGLRHGGGADVGAFIGGILGGAAAVTYGPGYYAPPVVVQRPWWGGWGWGHHNPGWGHHNPGWGNGPGHGPGNGPGNHWRR